jgi:hypothetical protein
LAGGDWLYIRRGIRSGLLFYCTVFSSLGIAVARAPRSVATGDQTASEASIGRCRPVRNACASQVAGRGVRIVSAHFTRHECAPAVRLYTRLQLAVTVCLYTVNTCADFLLQYRVILFLDNRDGVSWSGDGGRSGRAGRPRYFSKGIQRCLFRKAS